MLFVDGATSTNKYRVNCGNAAASNSKYPGPGREFFKYLSLVFAAALNHYFILPSAIYIHTCHGLAYVWITTAIANLIDPERSVNHRDCSVLADLMDLEQCAFPKANVQYFLSSSISRHGVVSFARVSPHLTNCFRTPGMNILL